MTTVLREAFASFAAWNSSGGTIVPGGRAGTGAQLDAGEQAHFSIPAAAQSDWLTIGFAVQLTGTVGEHQLLYLLGSGGSVSENQLSVTTAGALQLRRTSTGAVVAGTAAGVVPFDTWVYIELQVRLHGTLGAAVLRVNDVQHAAVTNVNTRSSAAGTLYDWFYIYGGVMSGQVHFFDDLYLKTGAGETFLGDTSFGPEAQLARISARVGFDEPPRLDQQRLARISARVGFDEPDILDQQRLAHQSLRVAFQGADIATVVGGIHARLLARPTGGSATVGYLNARVLSRPTGGHALLSATRLQVLRPYEANMLKFWDGTSWVAGPVTAWTGSAFQPVPAVRVWNGTAWVQAI